MNRVIIFLLIGIVFVSGCSHINSTVEINEEICKSSGGFWNECGSACAGTNSEICITVCVPQCECGGIVGFACPLDYSCRLAGGIADEMGVCVNE